MQAGLNLYSLRKSIGTEEDFLATAEKLKEMGYSYLQYSGAAFDPERIRRVCEASGMPVFLTHVPMDRILSDTEKLMEEHALFGCKNIGLGMMPWDTAADKKKCRETVEKLERAAEKMKENGFAFFYHHHHFEFYRWESGKRPIDCLLEEAPDVNFTADTYWLQFGGADVLAWLGRMKGRVGCVHLKDYRIAKAEKEGGGWEFRPQFAPVGDGNLDFPAIVKRAKESGAEYFFVEQDDACDYPDPFGQVKRSIGYIRSAL